MQLNPQFLALHPSPVWHDATKIVTANNITSLCRSIETLENQTFVTRDVRGEIFTFESFI